MKIILQKFREKCKLWWEAHESDVFLAAIILLLVTSLFGAIRLMLLWRSSGETQEIRIEENAFPVSPKQGLGQAMPTGRQARFVASINGERYYPAGCKAANRIKEENRIWFSSEKEAREMDYTPSAQC